MIHVDIPYILLSILKRLRFRYVGKDTFTFHVLTLMTGTTIAQAVPIAIAPILTRIYAPSDFGVFALFAAIVATIGVAATARYEMAIVLPDCNNKAANLFALSIVISFAISFLSLIIICVFNEAITIFIGDRSISQWLYWVPCGILLTGIYQALNYWSSRSERYQRLSLSKINQSISTSSVNLVLGVNGFGGGLIFGGLSGQFFATSVLGWQVWKDDNKTIRSISGEKIKNAAWEYREFPSINLIHALIDSIQTSGVVFVVFSFFGNVALGYFSFSQRILKAPISLIGTAIGQVFYRKASEVYLAGGCLHRITKKTMLTLSLFSAPIFILLYFSAPDLFVFLFGDKWEIAGRYAQIMLPLFLLNFITSPVSQVALIIKKQKMALLIGGVYNFTMIAPLVGSFYVGATFETGLWYSSILSSIVLIFYFFWLMRITKMSRIVND